MKEFNKSTNLDDNNEKTIPSYGTNRFDKKDYIIFIKFNEKKEEAFCSLSYLHQNSKPYHLEQAIIDQLSFQLNGSHD